MSAPDFRAFRATVLDAMATLQTETEHKLEDMAAGQRASEFNAQWYADMASAAVAILVDREVFATVADAEDAVEARAEAAREERKAARLAAAV